MRVKLPGCDVIFDDVDECFAFLVGLDLFQAAKEHEPEFTALDRPQPEPKDPK